MINVNTRRLDISKIFGDRGITSKIFIYFGKPIYGDDYDTDENNKTFSELSRKTIYGYLTEFTPESSYWRNYGRVVNKMKIFITDKKYKTWFENCIKIEIDGEEYEVNKNSGDKLNITDRKFNIIRVILNSKN